MSLKRLVEQSVLALLSLSIFSSTTFAIGVSPAIIEVLDIMQENQVSRILFLSRSDSSKEEAYNLTLSGEGSETISLENTHILFQKGETRVQVPFTISPEKSTPGEYNVKIQINLDSTQESSESQIVVSSGVYVDIKFTVTLNEIEKGEVQMGNMEETYEGDKLSFYYIWMNTGNVAGSPEKIDLSLIDTTTGVEYEESILAQNLISVPPFSQENCLAKTSITPPTGVYNLTIVFYDKAGQPIYDYEALHQVHIKDATTIQIQNEPNSKTYAIVITLLALTGIVALKPLFKK